MAFIVKIFLLILLPGLWFLNGFSKKELNENYNKEFFKKVDWIENPTGNYVHGPRPIPDDVKIDILKRSDSIVFDEKEKGRLYSSLLKKKTTEEILKNLKKFLIVYLKMKTAENRNTIVGASEGGDLLRFTCVAICDEIAFIGLNDNLEPNENTKDFDPDLFKALYNSCKLTNTCTNRIERSPHARVEFLPTKEDLDIIIQKLGINTKSDILCTYKRIR